MKSIILLALTLMICILVSGCSNIAFTSRMKMRLGMDKNQVIKLVDNERYMSFINDPVSDLHDISNNVSGGHDKYEVLIIKSYNIEGKDYYLFAFNDGKLLYWGYPYEFKRSEKSVLRAIGKTATDIIYKQYEN